MNEKCGKVAKYRVFYVDGKVMFLCTRHFSNRDIQYLVTRKVIKQERLENGMVVCEVEVERGKVEKSVGGKDAEKHEDQGDRGGDKEDPEGVA